MKYLVKWVGYPTSQATWEPKENLDGCKKVMKDYERKSAKKMKPKKQYCGCDEGSYKVESIMKEKKTP